ncbi:MmgE/PrpD family protein [Streptomyces sp. NPDC050560]|uniref:MmgE/PrpD family protein n=1 Tax=Streptomyces sp. NPDC050560 TaxID=3365630 RepID=UPI0037B19271
MSDATTRALARRSLELLDRDIPGRVLDAAALRLLDTLACAAGGSDSPPAAIARAIAARHSGTPPARVLGTAAATDVEHAAFAGAVMARYLDCNDTYAGAGSGHPSDMVPALLAVAESVRAPGPALLRAIVAGYEAYGAIAKTVSVRSRGWDQGVMTGLGATVGAGLLLGLGQERLEHAVALAATMSVPTRATRAGALSMWKGCATAAAVRLGVFAAQLAADGMTGPDRAFEGKDGLWQQVTGEFAVRPFGGSEPWLVEATSIKERPVEFHAQAPVEMVLALREEAGVDAADVAGVRVDTYWNAYDEIAGDPAKWSPETRETADHSLPYLVAVALVHGPVTVRSFDPERLADPEVRALLARVTVREDPGFTARWPGEAPCRVTVTTHEGRTRTAERTHPLGHPARPLSRQSVETKFTTLATPLLGPEGAARALEGLRGVAETEDAGRIVDLLVPPDGGGADAGARG